MKDLELGDMELQFANLIWSMAPVASGMLVKVCADTFSWKKSTTYTMLKRLCDRGIFENDGGTVKVILSRNAFLSEQSMQFVEETFSGSLPRFLTAFSSKKPLDDDTVTALEQMIAAYRRENSSKEH